MLILDLLDNTAIIITSTTIYRGVENEMPYLTELSHNTFPFNRGKCNKDKFTVWASVNLSQS